MTSLVVQSRTGGSLIVNTPGIPGPPAPAVQVQYSIDGSSWSTSYISNAVYIRLSLDGGSTYPVGPLRLRGDIGVDGLSAYEVAVENSFVGTESDWLASLKGDPAPQVRIEYSSDGDEWHSAASDGDNYLRISVDDGDTWGSPLLTHGLKGEKGDAAPYVSTEYSLDGVSWSSAYTDGDAYLRLSVDGGITWGSSLMIRGSKGDPGDKGDKGDPGQDGIDGIDGADGRTILSGSVDPTTEGEDGDFYINTATTTLFGPKNVTWPTGVSLVGPAGADGAGIPAISEGDSGKVLAVKSDESGTEWVTLSSGGVSLGLVIALS